MLSPPLFSTQKIYPTEEFEAEYKTNTPVIFACVVAGTFVVVALFFVVYDFMVLKRNEKMVANAAKSNAIVSSFVPDHLRDRLLNTHNLKGKTLKTFLSSQHSDGRVSEDSVQEASDPLADLFLDCTVCFADIVGRF